MIVIKNKKELKEKGQKFYTNLYPYIQLLFNKRSQINPIVVINCDDNKIENIKKHVEHYTIQGRAILNAGYTETIFYNKDNNKIVYFINQTGEEHKIVNHVTQRIKDKFNKIADSFTPRIECNECAFLKIEKSKKQFNNISDVLHLTCTLYNVVCHIPVCGEVDIQKWNFHMQPYSKCNGENFVPATNKIKVYCPQCGKMSVIDLPSKPFEWLKHYCNCGYVLEINDTKNIRQFYDEVNKKGEDKDENI